MLKQKNSMKLTRLNCSRSKPKHVLGDYQAVREREPEKEGKRETRLVMASTSAAPSPWRAMFNEPTPLSDGLRCSGRPSPARPAAVQPDADSRAREEEEAESSNNSSSGPPPPSERPRRPSLFPCWLVPLNN
jgi:hypothetical protein